MIKCYIWWAIMFSDLHVISAVEVFALDRWVHRSRSASNLLSILYSSFSSVLTCWAEQISIISWLWLHVWFIDCIKVYICEALYSYLNESLTSVRSKSTFQCTSQCTTESSSMTHIALSIMSWSQRPSCYFFYIVCLETCYSF